jgi:hypothetical protein
MKPAAFIAAALAAIVLVGCGGSGRLSKSDYRAKLTTIGHEANQAQTEVEKGLSAKTIGELHARLVAFADASQRLGDEVAALKTPKDAEAANAELARGEHDTARATRAAAAAITSLKTPKRALAYLQTSLGNAKGAHELDDAIAKLKKLGYAKGS